jgi:RHS repeat-associated protein
MKLQPVIHHIEYMPSGEQPAMSADKFSEQRDIWATPYKFNGKELDAETGLYYYGARYYTPEIGIWLSACPPKRMSRRMDPLSDERPSLSPYNYCQLNPVMRVDPTGMLDDEWEVLIKKDGSLNVNKMSNLGGSDLHVLNFSKENEQGDHIQFANPIALSGNMSESDLSSQIANVSNNIGLGLGIAAFSGDRLLDFSTNLFQSLQAESNALKHGLDYGSELGKLGKLGNVFRWTGVFGGFLSMASSGMQLSQAQSFGSQAEHGIDTFMGGVGFAGPVGAGISIYWGKVGKPLHNKWQNNVLMPQIKMGIEGFPSVMPFK